MILHIVCVPMPDTPPPEPFDDVNEEVVEEWKQEMSPYTRYFPNESRGCCLNATK